jgi:hypothetical protein
MIPTFYGHHDGFFFPYEPRDDIFGPSRAHFNHFLAVNREFGGYIVEVVT